MAAPRKPWKRQVAERHIVSLCRRNGIAIRWLKGRNWMDKAESSEVAKLVHIPHPHNARQYLVALHEVGHILSPITYRKSADHGWGMAVFHLACEASADAWAMEHIHPELLSLLRYEDIEATTGKGMAHHTWSVAVADLGL